jgi:hypothetical protein
MIAGMISRQKSPLSELFKLFNQIFRPLSRFCISPRKRKFPDKVAAIGAMAIQAHLTLVIQTYIYEIL